MGGVYEEGGGVVVDGKVALAIVSCVLRVCPTSDYAQNLSPIVKCFPRPSISPLPQHESHILSHIVQSTQVLERRITEAGMELEAYSAYLDLRRYGTVPHAGFGLGFERLVMFATGMTNIRDVIPFPRWPGHADS